MKFYFRLLLLLSFPLSILGQQAPPVVAVYPFTSTVALAGQPARKPAQPYRRPQAGRPAPGGQPNHPLASALEQATENALVNSHRFTVVERGRMAALSKEMKLQETMSDEQVAALGKTLGAQYAVVGNVQAVSSALERPGLVQGTVSFQVEMVEVATSQVKASEEISLNGNGANRQEALNNAVAAAEPRLLGFLNRNFPIVFTVLQATEVHKDEVRTLEIAAGAGAPTLQRKQSLNLMEISSVEADGQTYQRQVQVAELRVEEAEGQIYRCTVTKGGDIIKTKLDAKAKLVAVLKKE